MPEKDPSENYKGPPPPQITANSEVMVAYSPSYWYSRKAPVNKMSSARMDFAALVTAEDIDALEKEGIPVKRHHITSI